MTDLQKERFTMAPVALIDLMRDGVIKPQAYALWHVLWSHSDSEKRECWPGRGTLAQSLGLAQAKSVDPYIEQLVAVGAVVKFKRYDDNGEQLSNGYRLFFDVSAGRRLSVLEDGGSPEKRTGGGPKNGHEQEPVNNNQLTKTNLSQNRTGSERVSEKGDSSVTVTEDSDGKDAEVPTYADLLAVYPDSAHTKNDAKKEWERLTDDEKRRAVRAARKVKPNAPEYITGLGKWIRENKGDWPPMPGDMFAAALADPSSIGDLLRATGLTGPTIRWDDRPRDVAVREDNLAWLRANESMILTHLNR